MSEDKDDRRPPIDTDTTSDIRKGAGRIQDHDPGRRNQPREEEKPKKEK